MFGEALKNIRKDGYGDKKDGEEKKDGGPRLIKLTDDEAKALASSAGGEEVTCQVTGRVNGSELSVSSVSAPEGMDMKDAMMSGQGGPPLMRPSTMPSSS